MTFPITIVDSASTSTSGESSQSVITGTPTSGSVAQIVLEPDSWGTVGIAISGTFTGTLSFEGSPDGMNFATLDVVVQGINGTLQSTTAVGLFQVASAGMTSIRVRATATITGTAQVGFTLSLGNDVQHMVLLNAGALNVTIGNVGGLAAAGTAPSGNPLLVAGQDGTNVQTLLTDTSGRLRITGAAASGAALAGNPILVAGSDGTDARSLLTDATGRLLPDENSDTGALLTFTAAAAETTHSADQTNYNGTGLNCIVDITVATTTSLVLTIEGKDTASGKYYTILTSAALSSVATTLLSIFPGLTPAANTVVSAVLPKTWRVTAVITGASSALTGTVGASVV